MGGCGTQMGMCADGGAQSVQLRANAQQFASQYKNNNLPNNNAYGGGHQMGGQGVGSPTGLSMVSVNQGPISGNVPGDQRGDLVSPGDMAASSAAASMKAGMMVPKGGAMYGPGHQRSTPYPNPQQYMQSKRAQLIQT